MAHVQDHVIGTNHRGQEPKRQTLGDGHLEWISAEQELAESGGTNQWLGLFKSTADGWAATGCFEVEDPGGPSKTIMFCHWQEADAYYQAFEDRAWTWREQFSDDAVRNNIEKSEEQFRVAAVAHTRMGSPVLPWGRALLRALKENHEWFADAKADLKEQAEGRKVRHEVADHQPKKKNNSNDGPKKNIRERGSRGGGKDRTGGGGAGPPRFKLASEKTARRFARQFMLRSLGAQASTGLAPKATSIAVTSS